MLINNVEENKLKISREILECSLRSGKNTALQTVIKKAYCEQTGKAACGDINELYEFYVEGCKKRASDAIRPYDEGEARGRKRTPQKDSFDFSKPYKLATFTACYLKGSIPSPMFLKSICVSLRLTHTEADELLRAYGCLPFYSKNIFDLAIYSVLMMNELPAIKYDKSQSPFEIIERRYSEAMKIISRCVSKTELWELSEVTPIHTSAFLRDDADASYLMDEQKFYAFVERNAEYFSIRHGTVIAEHGKYLNALGGLYAARKDSLGGYSFKSFIQKFVDYKGTHYNRDVIRLAQSGDKNGYYVCTRELMILLWLYAEAFIFMSDPVPCASKHPSDIPNELYSNGLFNVRKYLFPSYAAISNWKGSETKSRINERLAALGWGRLSESNRFDRVINCLLSFSITGSSGRAFYSSAEGTLDYPIALEQDLGVPMPLQLIFSVLNDISALKYSRDKSALTKMNAVYSAFDSLDENEMAELRRSAPSVYNALRDRAFTKNGNGADYLRADSDVLFALLDCDCTALLNKKTFSPLDGDEAEITVRELLKSIAFFPLEANTYEKV